MKKLSVEEMRQVSAITLDPDIYMQALHCKNCIDDLINNPKNPNHGILSPEEYGQYEAKYHHITYPDGTNAGIIGIWCKHCKRPVWDSRHLIHAY